jgi:hypothetical protein
MFGYLPAKRQYYEKPTNKTNVRVDFATSPYSRIYFAFFRPETDNVLHCVTRVKLKNHFDVAGYHQSEAHRRNARCAAPYCQYIVASPTTKSHGSNVCNPIAAAERL